MDKLKEEIARLNKWIINATHGEDMIPIYEEMIREREQILTTHEANTSR